MCLCVYCMFVSVWSRRYMYVYMHTYTYRYTHTHTHTHCSPHCNTLQPTHFTILSHRWWTRQIVTWRHCNVLQHTLNTLQHRWWTRQMVTWRWRQNVLYLTIQLPCRYTLQHTATHCNTLQHTATHCNALQHAATHCNALQHTATHCNKRDGGKTCFIWLSSCPTGTHHNTLLYTARHCNTLLRTATHCNTLQHTATHTGRESRTCLECFI